MRGTGGTMLERAAEFLLVHARLVERRVFEHVFADGGTGPVVDAVRAYRNPDGGFGHALEPDVRASTSQPIHVHVALTFLQDVGALDGELVAGACSFLAGIADGHGAIPYLLPDALEHPRARHWNGDYALAPSLHATAGLVGRLHALGARDPWLDRATTWCLDQIAGHPEYTGHRMLNVLELLRHLPDRERADGLFDHVTSRLFEADHVLLETPITTYGLTPLWFARTPDSPARRLFTDAVIERHLAYLAAQQQEDGGWPISWEPPGAAAVHAWRGHWTLDALTTLHAYGRL